VQTIHNINPIFGFSLLSIGLLAIAITCYRWRLQRSRSAFSRVVLAVLAVFGLFGSGWCASSAVSARLAPDYLIRDIRTDRFANIVESVSLDSIDTSEAAKGDLEAYYYSDQPFLVTIDGFRGLLFLPARPETEGVVGVLPLRQILLQGPLRFRAHAIVAAKLQLMAGRRKSSTSSTQRNPPK
jgi:hypothetical protein